MTAPTQHPHVDELTEDERVEAARQYVHQLKAFYVHASVFAGSSLINFVINLVINLSAGIAGDWRSWWSLWAFLGWGIGIIVHGSVVRLNRPSSSVSTWEQKEIAKVLER